MKILLLRLKESELISFDLFIISYHLSDLFSVSVLNSFGDSDHFINFALFSKY